MTSQWAAVGAETDLLRRARQLQMSWERLLAGGALGLELPPSATAALRPTIVESWRRGLATGLDPTDLLAPIEADQSEVLGRWLEHPLGALTHVLTGQLGKVAEESRGIVVVADASGLVLHRMGDERLKERAAEMNLVEGARLSEAAAGTNGIGTALAADHALQVFGFEHFNERNHQWICSCAPVHDPMSGRVVALVDLSSHWKTAHPRGLELVTAAARTIEQSLVDARRDTDARLRRRYVDLMTSSTDLLVDGDGYVLEGAEPAPPIPFDIPDGGGEVVLGDESVAVAVSLGRGEAYILRRGNTRRRMSAPAATGLARVEERAHELASEQAALRQVATLVARESSPDQLFAVVAEQVAQVLDVPHVGLVRYEPDCSVVVGGYNEGDREPFAVGSRWPLDSPGVVAIVRHTGRSARLDDYADVPGEIAAVVRDAGMRSAVATPIVVEGRLWGAMAVLSPRHEPFPEGTEARLTDFTELIATAIANAEAREALARLADEQAALRRVATLVAQEVPQADVFGAIAEEIGGLLGVEEVRMLRFDSDGSAVVVGSFGRPDAFPLGSHLQLDGDSVASRVLRTRRPARFDDYRAAAGPAAETARSIGVRAVVGVPVLLEGRLWGAISAGSTHDGPLPPDTEARLDQFTMLMATAIANAQARAEVHRLADEQAALRRVAVLVAQQPSPSEVFTAVTQAVGLLLDADLAVLHVFPGDGTATTIASWSGDRGPILADRVTVSTLDGDSLAARIFESGAPARIDSYAEAEGEGADLARSLSLRSSVGAPILVEGKLWGALMAATRRAEPWAENAETRIAAFTELVATAVANAESSAELAASRRRIVAASDDARRRIERDLHDGVQQQLVSLGLKLGAMRADPPTGDAFTEQLAGVTEDVRSVLDALVEIARGIHPAILARGGLAAALKALARRSAVPVELHAQIEGPLPDEVEVAAYYVGAEALTNTAKHGRASVVQMEVTTVDGALTLTVRDDGVGGADLGKGSGLVGLQDRVEALGGRIKIDSTPGSGTCVVATIPIAMEPDATV